MSALRRETSSQPANNFDYCSAESTSLAYTIRLNHRHKLIGHVLSGRYKAQLVEGSLGGHHSGELHRHIGRLSFFRC